MQTVKEHLLVLQVPMDFPHTQVQVEGMLSRDLIVPIVLLQLFMVQAKYMLAVTYMFLVQQTMVLQ